MQAIIDYFIHLPLLELLAVFLSLAYVLLAARENNWCWPAAFVSTALYTVIFYDVALLMDSMLNIYYMAMAVYGWHHWQKNQNTTTSKTVSYTSTLDISHWSGMRHVVIIAILTVVSVILGYIMANYTQASFPYLDTATTVFAVFATYLVAQKVLENWLYWLVIDFVSIYLYIEKSLIPTAALFGIYVIIAVYGYWQWYQQYKRQNSQQNRNKFSMDIGAVG